MTRSSVRSEIFTRAHANPAALTHFSLCTFLDAQVCPGLFTLQVRKQSAVIVLFEFNVIRLITCSCHVPNAVNVARTRKAPAGNGATRKTSEKPSGPGENENFISHCAIFITIIAYFSCVPFNVVTTASPSAGIRSTRRFPRDFRANSVRPRCKELR